MASAIQLDQVTKRYGTTTALEDVSLDVPPGVVFAVPLDHLPQVAGISSRLSGLASASIGVT